MDVLDSGTMMSLNDEKHKLEAQLAGVFKLEERLKEVNKLLGKHIFEQVGITFNKIITGDGEEENFAYEEEEEQDDG